MNCRQVSKLIDAVPLRERSADELNAIGLHAEGCPACADRLDAAMRLEQDLSSLPAIRPSERFSRDVMRCIAQPVSVSDTTTGIRGIDSTFHPAAMAGVLVLVLALGLAGVVFYDPPFSQWPGALMSASVEWAKALFVPPSLPRLDQLPRITLLPDLHSIIVMVATMAVLFGFVLNDGGNGRPRSSGP